MDSFEVLIYIIFGVIYLLSRALKKKKKTIPKQSQREEGEVETQEQPVTFEDLLKELTGVQTAKPKPQPQPKRQERFDRSDPNEYEDYRSRRPVVDDSKSKEVFEQATRKAKGIKSIDELVDLEDGIEASGRFTEFKIEQKYTKGDEIREMFKNKQEAQKAIILAEILNRKY